MEKNSKTEILNNLQKTLNLLNKIDLTGGEKLTPEELKERIDAYIATKEQILEKIRNIGVKLGVFSTKYDEAMRGWNDTYTQYEDVNKKLEESEAKVIQLNEYNEGWSKAFEELKNEKNELDTKLEESEAKVIQLNEYNEDWSKAFEELKNEKTVSDSKLEEINAKNITLENEKAELNDSLTKLEDEKVALVTDLNTVTARNSNLEDDLSNMRSIENDINVIGSLIVRLGRLIGSRRRT